jgi:Uma2 family endonuclease
MAMGVATAHSPTATHSRAQFGEPAWAIAHLFPTQGNWTEAEYLALDTNKLVELADGYLEVHPMATYWPQVIVRMLFGLLEEFVKMHSVGEVLFAPLPVRLGSLRFREPDILYLRPERLANIHKQPEGADLVMEVVSEGQENRDRDLITKPEEYAAARIPEYWIVDPHLHIITVLVLDKDSYRIHGEFRAGTHATSVLLPGFPVDVDALFATARGIN